MLMVLRAATTRDFLDERNVMLRTLSPADRALIEPHLETVTFAPGEAATCPGDPISALLFPDHGVFAIEEAIAGRQRIEVALVGSEGLLGWPALLGADRALHGAIVQMQPARARRIALAPLTAACQASPTLHRSLLRFVHVIGYQMARAIAGHLETTLEQRIARWLLMRHDRIVGDQLLVRHDEIADGLNARRASVTTRLHLLEGERMIRSRRGRIAVESRAGLEAFAGEAYGAAEREYRRLIGPFGRPAA